MKPSTSTDIAICALLLALTPLLGACSQEDSPVYVIGPDGKPILHTQQLSLASGKWVLPEIQDEDTLMLGRSEMGEEFRGGPAGHLVRGPGRDRSVGDGCVVHAGGGDGAVGGLR